MQVASRTEDLYCQETLFPVQLVQLVRQVAQQVLGDFKAFQVPLDQVVLSVQLGKPVLLLGRLVRRVMLARLDQLDLRAPQVL
jgi:hypothetical protein